MKLFVFLLVLLGVMFVYVCILIFAFLKKVRKVNNYIFAIEIVERLDSSKDYYEHQECDDYSGSRYYLANIIILLLSNKRVIKALKTDCDWVDFIDAKCRHKEIQSRIEYDLWLHTGIKIKEMSIYNVPNGVDTKKRVSSHWVHFCV